MINKTNSKATKCPVCKKISDNKYRPFCSKRCSDIDLGKWLTESYFVEGSTEEAHIAEED